MTSLSIRLLGPPQVERDGVALTFATRKAVALLAYLVVTGARPTRDALATMFWPEANQAAARNALRYTLGVLKKTIGSEWLVSDRESIALAPQAALRLDVTAFRQQIASSQAHDHPETGACPVCVDALTQAVACYGGVFMAGFTLPEVPPLTNGARPLGALLYDPGRLAQGHRLCPAPAGTRSTPRTSPPAFDANL